MGRPANQYNQSQGWRIQKQRREEARSKLPAWYWRVLSMRFDSDVEPGDYDEDISELGESDKSSEEDDERECDCGDDVSECDCDLKDGENTDEESGSEKTCNGSDAELYYELKEERKTRKRELLEGRKREEKAKELEKEFVKGKEDEVNAAYQAFRKARRRAKKRGEKIPIDFTASRSYKLYSSDHVEWAYDHSIMYSTQRADFDYIDECDGGAPSPNDGSEKPLYGQIYLDGAANCTFGPIPVPKRARRKDMAVTSSGDGGGKYDLRLKFFGNEYLKVSVPRALVEGGLKLRSGAPERFEFVGIVRDLEEEKIERKKACPASPRESYFEMDLW
ncbi:hypothetical protein F5882DRAFT_413781 [Hyaloscypha sp. PMI_1271]|nr:hypothetical protein F5882DRAFT_413781 [Hyaloscypha sp. PMI_1271]